MIMPGWGRIFWSAKQVRSGITSQLCSPTGAQVGRLDCPQILLVGLAVGRVFVQHKRVARLHLRGISSAHRLVSSMHDATCA